MKRIIIEGITGSGKSTVYKKLVDKFKVDEGSNLLFLNEYITWRTFEKEKDIGASCGEIFTNISVFIRWLTAIFINAGLQNTSRGRDEQLCCLMEGFHWNAYVRGILSEKAFHNVENEINNLGFEIVFLVLSESNIKNRSVIETRQFRTRGWNKYLNSLGNSDDEIAQIFQERQNRYYDIYSCSTSKKILINTDEKRWDDYVEQIIALGERQ